VAGAALLVLAGSAVGIAAAQSQPAATPSSQQGQSAYQRFIDALAKRLNISSQALETAVGQARQDAGLPAGGPGFPGGFGRGGPHGGFHVDLNAAATAIGITPQQLRTELAGKSLAQVAQAHNKTANDVAAALKDAAHQRIDAAVTAGRIAADQASTQKTQADTRIDQLVNQVMPQGGPGNGRGNGGFGFGGRGGLLGAGLDAAATAIGITPDQLRTELPGKSLAQVAQAHNKSAADVATALKNAAHQRIDAAVTAGKLTADQANAMKTQADQRIDQFVNQVVPQRGTNGAPGADLELSGQ
jgi:polyhydroxyalkanoate synthesis regulator phasin